MIDGLRVLALVPARAGSKGLPGKNIRPLAGKPLLAWPIAAARGSTLVDRVVISTDSPEFAEIAVAHGADCPFLRPVELASDTAPSIDFILDALDKLEMAGDCYDILLLLEPTSPLTETSDIDAALAQLVAAGDAADAIVGVSAMETQHPAFSVLRDADGRIRPAQSADFAHLPRRQDLTPVFALDGSLYASRIEALRRARGFCHDRTLGYVTERHKHFEVDDLVDFIAIEAVLNRLPEIRAAQESKTP